MTEYEPVACVWGVTTMSEAAMASATAIRAIIGARQQWQIASASASAASAGVGFACSARILVTIAVT